MGYKDWNTAEKLTVLGFLLGLILLALSYFFKYRFDWKFCIPITNLEICIRYVSLLPFTLALLGLILGLIFGKRKVVEEELESL